MTRSVAPAEPATDTAGAAPFRRSLASSADGPNAPADAAPRPPRRLGRTHGPVRGLGDARAVRRRHPGAPRGPGRLWRLRRLAHGRVRDRGPTRDCSLASDPLERSRKIGPGQAQYTLL